MKDIIEIFQVRKALEGVAARLAAEKVDLEALKKFEDFYSTALEKNSSESIQEIFDLGIKFHDFVISNAGNQRIEKILNDFRLQFEISRKFFLNQTPQITPSRAVQIIKEHLGIIEAFKKRDGELAEDRMKEHVVQMMKSILFRFREFIK